MSRGHNRVGAGRKASVTNEAKQSRPSGLIPFKPGQSGNPKGRPKGSRHKLGEDFLCKLQADFEEHGVAVIQTVRTDKPAEYLKVIAGILPKQIDIKTDMDEMSDDELAALRSAIDILAGHAVTVAATARSGNDEATQH